MARFKKLFGELNLSTIKKAFINIPNKKSEYNGDNFLKVEAKHWDNGDVSLYIWDAVNHEEIRLGRLKLSKYN